MPPPSGYNDLSMPKKVSRPRSASNATRDRTALNWKAVPQQEFFFYARSFHNAAKNLAGSAQLDGNSVAAFDVCPVVFMYRHALELHLKALVLGDGSNFLATKPDRLSIYKTHSLSWLAQFVCQIVTALKWEKEFKCAGIENLADFKAFIEEVSSVDPGAGRFRCLIRAEGEHSDPGRPVSVRELVAKMDALLGLLDVTADALAATWDIRGEAAIEPDLCAGDDVKETIH